MSPVPARGGRRVAPLALALALLPGCAYLQDRGRDAMDPWTAGVEYYHLPLVVIGKATVVHAGFGMIGGTKAFAPGAGVGFLGRRGGTAYQPLGGLLINGWIERTVEGERRETHVSWFLDDRLWHSMGAGFLVVEPDLHRDLSWNADAADIQLSLGIVGGARAGVNPFEILDLLLGFATIDLAGDDAEEEHPEAPKRKAAPEGERRELLR